MNQSCKRWQILANYSLLEMDSTFCKVHKDETGALKKHGDQAQLIKVLLTGGHIHDIISYLILKIITASYVFLIKLMRQ